MCPSTVSGGRRSTRRTDVSPDHDDDVERAPIRLAEVLEVRLPLLRPFVTGFGVTDTRHTVLVHLVDEAGLEGWGEGPALDHPYYLPDTTAGTFTVARDYALPLALAAGRVGPTAVYDAMTRIRGNTFAKAAVEAAFWALEAARRGSSMRELFGGARMAAPVGESLSITETVAETLDEVRLRLDEGYRRIKLKIQPRGGVAVGAAGRGPGGAGVMVQAGAERRHTPHDARPPAPPHGVGPPPLQQPP